MNSSTGLIDMFIGEEMQGHINTHIEEEISDLINYVAQADTPTRLKFQGSKVLVSAYTPYSLDDVDKHIEFICIVALLLDTDYVFLIDKSWSAPCILDISKEKTPEHFIEGLELPKHIDLHPIVEFIDSYPYKNPILLLDERLKDYTDVFESITFSTNFERTDDLCEYLKDHYITFSIHPAEAIVDLYEL